MEFQTYTRILFPRCVAKNASVPNVFLGDAEKNAGIPITSFMNRETSTEYSVAQTQVTFLFKQFV